MLHRRPDGETAGGFPGTDAPWSEPA
jgi:hypothetical protein